MKAIGRREFLGKSLAGTAGLTLPFVFKRPEDAVSINENKLLNAYYFRAHMYTLVPDQIKYDMDRMASVGTKAVSIAILEQDLFAAVENVDLMIEEASKRDMKVFAVPSRWGGLLAGAPKVPSLFTTRNHHTWMISENGDPYDSSVSGRISSIHYPETVEFFKTGIKKIFDIWNINGVIWDEPKNMKIDYSEKAMENLSGSTSMTDHLKAVKDFYTSMNKYIKSIDNEILTSMFIYANVDDQKLEIMSDIEHLDYFGCDGRPWYSSDGGQDEGHGKCLLDSGLRFLEVAERKKKNSLWLVENHNLNEKDTELLKKRLPETLAYSPDQLIYYYFPRNLSNPEEIMGIIEKNIKERY